MIFSKKAIKRAIEASKFKIVPFSEDSIDKAHIDLHLGSDDDVTLQPKGFVLAQTLEKITLSEDLCGFIEGRATLAKQGVSVERSSTLIEPGSDSHMTLEISSASDTPCVLKARQPIAKMYLVKLTDEI